MSRDGTSACTITTEPMLDRAFEALEHPRRRVLLYCLREQERIDVGELADRIAAQERENEDRAQLGEAAGNVEAALIHHHLPKLDEYGIVDFDRRSGTVRFSRPPDPLAELLDVAEGVERSA